MVLYRLALLATAVGAGEVLDLLRQVGAPVDARNVQLEAYNEDSSKKGLSQASDDFKNVTKQMKQSTKFNKSQFQQAKQLKERVRAQTSEATQLDQLENVNFDSALPGGGSGKPDKDELEMMNDIMGGDMMTDEQDITEQKAPKKVALKPKKIVTNPIKEKKTIKK